MANQTTFVILNQDGTPCTAQVQIDATDSTGHVIQSWTGTGTVITVIPSNAATLTFTRKDNGANWTAPYFARNPDAANDKLHLRVPGF